MRLCNLSAGKLVRYLLALDLHGTPKHLLLVLLESGQDIVPGNLLAHFLHGL